MVCDILRSLVRTSPGKGYESKKLFLDLELGRDMTGITFLKDFSICIGGNEMDWISMCGSGNIGGYYWQEMI